MAQPNAVHYFAPDHPALSNTVRVRIEKRIAELSTQVAEGYAADWGDYRERAGVIKGLREAHKMCIETDDDLRERA